MPVWGLERSDNRQVTVDQTVIIIIECNGNTDPKLLQIENLELGSLNLGMHFHTYCETTFPLL